MLARAVKDRPVAMFSCCLKRIQLGIARLLEAAFESWVGVVPLGLCTCSWAHDWGANGSLANRTVDVKVCLFAFEIKELSQAAAARL